MGGGGEKTDRDGKIKNHQMGIQDHRRGRHILPGRLLAGVTLREARGGIGGGEAEELELETGEKGGG